MKILSLLFSFYLFGLFVMPCTDNCLDEKEHHEAKNSKSEHQEHQEKNPCSPFCACACCGVRVIQPEVFVLAEFKIFQSIQELNVQYQSPVFLKFTASIWHPPKTV